MTSVQDGHGEETWTGKSPYTGQPSAFSIGRFRWGTHPMAKSFEIEWSSTIAMLENFALILASGSHANTGEQAALEKFHDCFPEGFKERGDEVRKRLMWVPRRRRWNEGPRIVGQRWRIVSFNEFMHSVNGIHGQRATSCRCVNRPKAFDGIDRNKQKSRAWPGWLGVIPWSDTEVRVASAVSLLAPPSGMRRRGSPSFFVSSGYSDVSNNERAPLMGRSFCDVWISVFAFRLLEGIREGGLLLRLLRMLRRLPQRTSAPDGALVLQRVEISPRVPPSGRRPRGWPS